MNEELRQWVESTCADLGSAVAQRPRALTAEASHRQFYRVPLVNGTTLIAMDSPPALERNDQFVALARMFGAAGLPVPVIRAAASDAGWFLLTDVGAADLKDRYEQGQAAVAVETALRWLARWQRVRHPLIEPYSGARLHMELKIFSDYVAQQVLADPLPVALERDLFGWLIEQAQQQATVCVHRDYHCRNLLLDEAGRFGIVDFQDALQGPLCYDLASLLYDCYHRFDDDFIGYARAFFRALVAPQINASRFARMTETLAIQRQLKALGIFARLQLRDGKASHLRHIEPTLTSLLGLTERYPQTRALHRWLDDRAGPISAWARQADSVTS